MSQQTTTPLSSIPPLTGEGATAFQFRSTGNISSGGLTIPKRNGHRRTLLDVFVTPETAGVMVQIQVGDRIYVRIPTTLGDYTAVSNTNNGVGMIKNENARILGQGLLQYLHRYIPFDFPTAAQDEDIIITLVAPLGYGAVAGTFEISAYYIDQDSGDVTSKIVAGGSANPRRLYVNMATNGSGQATTGQTALDTSVVPSGLNGLTDNSISIAGLKFTAYMLAYDGSALGTTTGGNANGRPTRLHITDVDIEVFCPETTEGLLVDRNIQNLLAFDLNQETFYLPYSPYVFHNNRKFRFLLDTSQKAGAGANFTANTQLFVMLGIREPEGS